MLDFEANANSITITSDKSISYLQSNNVGGSGTGGTLGSGDNIYIGSASSGSNSTVTLTIDANATVNSIKIGDVYGVLGLGLGKINGLISFSGNYTFTVTTDIVLGDYTSILGLGSTSSAGSIDMTNGGYLKCRIIGVTVGYPASCVGTFTPGTGTVEFTGTFILNHSSYSAFNNLVINSASNTVVMYETPTTISGSLTLNSGVLDVNNQSCDISIKGDWINNVGSSAFVYGTRTVSFTGTGSQSLGGTATTSFYNLTINKASGTLSLAQNITVVSGGVLNLTAGAVSINKKTLTINNSSTGAITRTSGYLISEDNTTTSGKANNASYVIWAIGSTTGAHIFPFANSSGVYIPFTYNLSSGNIGNLTLSTYASAADNTPMPAPVSQLHDTTSGESDNSYYTVDRYWNIAASGSGTGNMIFSYADSEIPAAGETGSDGYGMRAQQWNSGGSWAYDSDPTAATNWVAYYRNQSYNTASNTVTVNAFPSALSSTMPWTLALHVHPLPVTLTSFTAQQIAANKTLIHWETQQEVNCDYFEIEKKTADNWISVGTITGNGSSSVQHTYNYTDNSPVAAFTYYRLKQIDFNGTASYSDIVSISSNNALHTGTSVCLLPGGQEVQLNFYSASENGNASVNIINTAGQIIYRTDLSSTLSNGMNSQRIATDQLANGLYIVELLLNNDRQALKFVKN